MIGVVVKLRHSSQLPWTRRKFNNRRLRDKSGIKIDFGLFGERIIFFSRKNIFDNLDTFVHLYICIYKLFR